MSEDIVPDGVTVSDNIIFPEPTIQATPLPETPVEVVQDIISLDSLMNDHAMLLQRESNMKSFLTDQLINVSAASLKPTLLQWAISGFPSAFVLLKLPINPPEVCSDGVSRTVSQYIDFCMGTDAPQVYLALSSKLPDIMVSYATIGCFLFVYVSKY